MGNQAGTPGEIALLDRVFKILEGVEFDFRVQRELHELRASLAAPPAQERKLIAIEIAQRIASSTSGSHLKQAIAESLLSFPEMTSTVEQALCERIAELEAVRDTLRAALEKVLASAVPNERDHPTMCVAWKAARGALVASPVEPPATLLDHWPSHGSYQEQPSVASYNHAVDVANANYAIVQRLKAAPVEQEQTAEHEAFQRGRTDALKNLAGAMKKVLSPESLESLVSALAAPLEPQFRVGDWVTVLRAARLPIEEAIGASVIERVSRSSAGENLYWVRGFPLAKTQSVLRRRDSPADE
jgi:hypothetical protein